MAVEKEMNQESPEFVEQVVNINRVSKVVKGGRRFGFSVLVVAGDRNGRVGYGLGKAKEVAEGIRKGSMVARKNLYSVARKGTTIPYCVTGKFSAARVILRPAREGTGVIAGGAVRAVMEVAGISDVLAKSLGSSNPLNLVRAAIDALMEAKRIDKNALLREAGTAEATQAGPSS